MAAMDPFADAENVQDFIQFNPYTALSMELTGIHKAVIEGNLDGLKQLIESGSSVNDVETHHSFTPLHLAAIKNDLKILEYLLARDDTDVNARCRQSRTSLHYAVVSGFFETVEKLVAAGADVNLPDSVNSSPLHSAVIHPRICHLLIRHGAQIDAFDDYEATPLHQAVRHSNHETMHMLLFYDADVNVTISKFKFTPFLTAFHYRNLEAQHVLLDYVDDLDRRHYHRSRFVSTVTMALMHNSPIAHDLIERGASVDCGEDPEALEAVCAFIACLFYTPFDVPMFRKLWDNLRYDESIETVDLVKFFHRVTVLPIFIPLILESDNLQPAIRFFSEGKNYCLLVDKFRMSKFDLNLLTVFTCRLLEEGFRPSSYDLYVVFRHYGYCELFRILLYMEIDCERGWLPRMILCRLICDVDYDLKDAVAHLGIIRKHDLLQWAKYYSVPPYVADRFSTDVELRELLDTLPRVPSLVELSRDAARKHIRNVFKATTCCQLYTVINHLPLSILYKSILTFERQLYPFKFTF